MLKKYRMLKNRVKPDSHEDNLIVLKNKYKKRFHISFIAFLAAFSLLLTVIYTNYDYLAFKYFMSFNYIYTEALDALYERELKIDAEGKYFKYFDNIAISAYTRMVREVNSDRYTFLYVPSHYEQSKQEEKAEALISHTKELSPSVIYLSLTNFSDYSLDIFKDAVNTIKNYSNIIIDLRDNRGGDIDAMKKISEYFLKKGSIIARDHLRLFNITYKAKRNQPLQFDNIIILQNGSTASASENMIAALSENLDNVTLIGGKTYGKGIGQYTLPLKRGFAIKATVLLWYSPQDFNYQGYGIEPDIAYDGEEPVAFAIDYINSRISGK